MIEKLKAAQASESLSDKYKLLKDIDTATEKLRNEVENDKSLDEYNKNQLRNIIKSFSDSADALRAVIEDMRSTNPFVERNEIRILEVGRFVDKNLSKEEKAKLRDGARRARLNFNPAEHKIKFKTIRIAQSPNLAERNISKAWVSKGSTFEESDNIVVMESDITIEVYNENTGEFLGHLKKPGNYYIETSEQGS